MIGALLDGDESLQPIHGAQHADQSLVAFGRHARIVGMARHPNLILIGNGNHSLEEIGDSLPEHVGVHASSLGERRIRMRILKPPRAVHRVAPPWSAFCAQDAQ